MMTRSAQLKKRATINETPLNSDTEPLDDKIYVQDHLARAQEGVEILLKQVKSLRERNETLTAELQDLRDAADPSNRSSNEDLQEQVRVLKRNIRKLEKAQQKFKEKIQKYQADEIKHEAADLEDPADHDVGETTHTMRKLLRRFSDLMSMNVLDKDEECVVCLETMTLKQCSSLPCQHLICNTCLPQICKVDWSIRSTDSEGEQGEEVTKCPLCREQTPRRDVELLHYTATGQWDALLEIVKEWVKMDRRRADETSDEEEEEDFIREASTNASSSASSESPNASRGSTPESDLVVDRAVTPPQEAMRSQSNTARGYLTSPSATKRKRMEELAKQRTKKKRL